MRLDILAGLLQTANLGTIGTNIFAHRMDADCKVGILLRLPLDGVPVDVNLPGYYKHSVQLVVRAGDQATGDALIANAVNVLTIYNQNFYDTNDVLEMQINHLVPRTLPRVYPRLEGQGVEWSVDLNANYVMP